MHKVKEFTAKYRRQFLILITGILTVVSLINFYFLFNITAQSNDECLWIPTTNEDGELIIIFNLVKVEGVTWEAGIRDGDRFYALDGEKIENGNQATLLLDVYESGEYATYTVMRGDERFVADVEIKKLINFTGLGLGLLGLFWLIVGFIVVIVRPDGKTQMLFYKIGVSAILMSLYSLLTRGNQDSNPVFFSRWIAMLIDVLWTLGASYFAFLILRFFLQFPERYKVLNKKWMIKLLTFSPVVLFIISFLFRVIFVYGGIPNLYINVIIYHFGIVILASLISVFLLLRSYLRIKEKAEKKPILIILLSTLLGVASIIFTLFFANVFADSVFNSPQYFMPIILVMVIPIAFGYSIFRYSLMDISDVVKNAIIYSTATITLAGAYFLIIYLIGQSLSQAIGTQYRSVIAGGTFIIFALVFQSTKDKFQALLTRRFYPEQFAFHNVMIQFSNDVTTIVGLDNILDSAHQTFVDSLKLERFGIALYDETYDDYKIKRSTGLRSRNAIIKESQRRIHKLVENKKILRLLPVIERSDFEDIFTNDSQKFIDEEIYTIIPLIIKSKVIGLVLFGLKFSGSQFAGKDLELLVASANHTAVSIENARLYESEAEKTLMEQDLNNARKIQEGLLPKAIPHFDSAGLCGRMIPATYVGGDYFDIIKLSDSKFFVVIGDVSGKGLSASLYMSKLQTMMSLYCTEDRSPKEILREINKRMYESIEKNWFITVSLGLFDLEENRLTFCRAGHTPLLWIEDSEIKSCQSKGIGVGLEKGEIFDTSLEVTEIQLKQEQLFVFFSDGVNELMNKENELFGLKRLENLMLANKENTPSDSMNAILKALERFRGKTPQYDDITLVVVKIR
ncbi:SpoIIE family protein phosphatase [Bacteroidota bacterium]